MDIDVSARALRDCFIDDKERNLVDALFSIAYQLKQLGNGDAFTPMGALEALGSVLKEAIESHAGQAEQIADALNRIASAMPPPTTE